MNRLLPKIENLKLLYPEMELPIIVRYWAHPNTQESKEFKTLKRLVGTIFAVYETSPYSYVQTRVDRVNSYIDTEIPEADVNLAKLRHARYIRSLEDVCPLCLEGSPDVILSECRHYGHLKCYQEMVENGVPDCPICREEITYCIDLESDMVIKLKIDKPLTPQEKLDAELIGVMTDNGIEDITEDDMIIANAAHEDMIAQPQETRHRHIMVRVRIARHMRNFQVYRDPYDN